MVEAYAFAQVVKAIPATEATGRLTLGQQGVGSFVYGDLLTEGGCAGLRHTQLVLTCRCLSQSQQLHLPQIGKVKDVPTTTLGTLGQRGILSRNLDGPPPSSGSPPRGPFDFHALESGLIPEYPALWNHNAERERSWNVPPDRYGLLRAGQEEKGREVWDKYASALHITVDFRLNSQPLAACVTTYKTLGGTAWPNFKLHKPHHERALLMWMNSTLGLMLFWWVGTLQQPGRARLSIQRHPDLPVMDVGALTDSQLAQADALCADFEGCAFLPANEAWRDEARQALDRALLIDLLGLPSTIWTSLDLLRRQWCAEPSVYGTKWRTAPPEVHSQD